MCCMWFAHFRHWPLECMCWRQFTAQRGDCKKSRLAPLNAIIIIIIKWRRLTWLPGADLANRLWGSAEDLYQMAGFVASTGLKIWPARLSIAEEDEEEVSKWQEPTRFCFSWLLCTKTCTMFKWLTNKKQNKKNPTHMRICKKSLGHTLALCKLVSFSSSAILWDSPFWVRFLQTRLFPLSTV